ncbi:hypothetical protein ACFW9L_21415 [Streptomyces sp. NPDC059517]|uniref:hypothetical protein n=1 Tax=Streptomyces sp. NPDC059517 TaxID=3346855 RepID=UPI00367ACD28
MGAEQRLVQPPVPQPVLGEAADDAAERTPRVGIVEGGPHVRAAGRDVLGERRGDQVGA